MGLHRVGPVPGRLHASCQQLGDHSVSQQGYLPACLPASLSWLSLQDSVPFWKQLRTLGPSSKQFLSCPSVSTHPLDPRFCSLLVWLQFSAQTPSQVSQGVPWDRHCGHVTPVARAALWPQGLRNHMLPEVIPPSSFCVSSRVM